MSRFRELYPVRRGCSCRACSSWGDDPCEREPTVPPEVTAALERLRVRERLAERQQDPAP